MSVQTRAGAALAGATLFLAAHPVAAAEGYRLRQPAFPLLGAEMGASEIERVGFFGLAAVSYNNAYDAVDNQGDPIRSPGQTIPLPTGALTGGALPDGTYSAVVQSGQIDFDQTAQQYNLLAGYLFDPGIKGARIGVSFNQIYQRSEREVSLAPQPISLEPAMPATLPAPLRAVLNGALANVSTQVDLRRAAELQAHNRRASGFGDTTFAGLYTQVAMDGRLRAAGAVSHSLDNGAYQADRGPNPGFNYRTTRIESAVGYSFADAWLNGVTVGARTAYGWNGENPETGYETGDFFNLELAAQKTQGDFAVGMTVFALLQTTDDRVDGVRLADNKYEAYGAGPFVAYRFPGRNLGLNLTYADTFGVRNGQVGRGVSLRLIRTW